MSSLRIYGNDLNRAGNRGKRAVIPVPPEKMHELHLNALRLNHTNTETQPLKVESNNTNNNKEDRVEKIGGEANQNLDLTKEESNEESNQEAPKNDQVPADVKVSNTNANNNDKVSEQGTCSVPSIPLIETINQGIASFSFNVSCFLFKKLCI